MRGNSGVTMIELVVVVVIILMIVSFSVLPSRETLDEADISKVYIEMKSMKTAVNVTSLKVEMDNEFEIKQGVDYDTPFVAAVGVEYGDNVMDNMDDWYIILGADQKELYEASNVKANYGLDAISLTYIVNFKTSDVELYKPITVANTTVRTFDEVRSLAEN